MFVPYDGSSFATGAMPYQYIPVSKNESANRIILQVEVGGMPSHYQT